MKRYERYADEIAESIRTGVLAPGDRLPSVRQATASRGISPSTVFQAYYQLEARGLVEARPRSGYYVRSPQRTAPAEPAAAVPSRDSTPVAISELVFEVLGSTRDAEVVPLGSAFPSPHLFPLARLARCGARAMRRLDPGRIAGDLTAGNERLRHQIARRYVADGPAPGADEIVITNGAMEALNLCLQAVTRPGDVVAVESPTFYAALQALERLELRAVEVATDPRLGVDPDALAEVLQRHRPAACWLMPNFQNPMGSLMPEPRKQALVELLARHGVPLVEDDVYGELYFGVRRPLPAKAFDREGLVMHCSSFSKCLAPGYRVGWTAAGRFAAKVQRLKLMTSLSTAIPSQLAIAEYLDAGGYDLHLRQLRQALAQQQAQVLQLVARHFPQGTRATRPEGGYFVWLELPDTVDALELHRQALAQSVSTAPGVLFSADRRFRRGLRLNCGHPVDARVEEAIRRLGALTCGLAAKGGG